MLEASPGATSPPSNVTSFSSNSRTVGLPPRERTAQSARTARVPVIAATPGQ